MSATPTLPARDTLPAAGTWQIDASHSTVQVVARHMVVSKVKGTFPAFDGTAEIAEDVTGSSVRVSIDAASIDTRSADRDGHLRSPDFLDVETFPTITFTSTELRHEGGNAWQLVGGLTLRGVTRPVTLDVEFLGTGTDPFGNDRAAFEATGSIDREDFDITWNAALETGGVLVSRELEINLDVQLVQG